MTALKQALCDEYGFADKRYKKLSSSNIFAVDGRNSLDVASDGQFYGWFCSVFVDTPNEPVISVRFYKNIPDGPEVRAWIQKNGATHVDSPKETLEFTVAPGEQQKLLELAEAFEVIASPGRRYGTAAYKYLCTRLGKAMRRLEKVLTTQWGGAEQFIQADAASRGGLIQALDALGAKYVWVTRRSMHYEYRPATPRPTGKLSIFTTLPIGDLRARWSRTV